MKLGVIKSLKPMLSVLLPTDDLREQLYDYIPLLLAEYRGGLEALFVTQVRGRRQQRPGSLVPRGVSPGGSWGLALAGFLRNECCCSRWKGRGPKGSWSPR